MAIITNAGRDDRLSPRERAAAEDDLQNLGIMQDAEAKGRAAAARRDAVGAAPVLLAPSEKVAFGEGEEQVTADRIVVGYQMEEPEYDERVPTLAPYVIEWVAEDWWPLHRQRDPKTGKLSKKGLRPVFPPKAWEALIDSGMYCLRCFRRHEAPNPDVCPGCDMTNEHRENVLRHLEKVGEMMQARRTPTGNRAERRAQQRGRRSRGGVYLPGGIGG